MRSAVELLPHDQAVKSALLTIGVPVGFVEAPAGALDGVLSGAGPDYIVMFPISGGSRDGSISDPYADAEIVYQITVVGQLPEGVRHIVGQLEPALVGAAVTGRRVLMVEPQAPGAVLVDRDVGPPHPFYGTAIFRLHTTPI